MVPQASPARNVKLREVLGPRLYHEVQTYRGDVALDVNFVGWRALTDCEYLRSLRKVEFSEGFYARVFGGGELMLLCPGDSKGGVREYLLENRLLGRSEKVLWMGVRTPVLGIPLEHLCASYGCRPSEFRQETISGSGKRP